MSAAFLLARTIAMPATVAATAVAAAMMPITLGFMGETSFFGLNGRWSRVEFSVLLTVF